MKNIGTKAGDFLAGRDVLQSIPWKAEYTKSNLHWQQTPFQALSKSLLHSWQGKHTPHFAGILQPASVKTSAWALGCIESGESSSFPTPALQIWHLLNLVLGIFLNPTRGMLLTVQLKNPFRVLHGSIKAFLCAAPSLYKEIQPLFL